MLPKRYIGSVGKRVQDFVRLSIGQKVKLGGAALVIWCGCGANLQEPAGLHNVTP